MKKMFLIFVIAIVLALPIFSQRYGPLDQEIFNAYNDYEKAFVKGDLEKLRGMYASEYLFTNADGELLEKEQVLKEIASGSLKVNTLRQDYERTRGYGETGMVNVIWTMTGRRNGRPFSSKHRASIFYAKRDNRWQIVAEHITPIKEQPDPPGLEAALINLERGAWRAWKMRNAKFFENYIVGSPSATSSIKKAAVFKDFGCTAKSYTLDNFKMKMLDDDKAVLNYTARQDAVCEGKRVPPAVAAATLFEKRGDLWQATFHDESPIK